MTLAIQGDNNHERVINTLLLPFVGASLLANAI
jgi:hypothetical protein